MWHSRLLSTISFLSLGAAILATPASSATYFSDRALWEAAVPSALSVIDFAGIAPSAGTAQFNTAAGLTIDGVNFVGNTTRTSLFGGVQNFNYLFVADPLVPNNTYDWGLPAVLGGPGAGFQLSTPTSSYTETGRLTITFTNPVAAAGFDIMSLGSGSLRPMLITLSTGETATVETTNHPSRSFFGFVSDTPITSIRIDPQLPTSTNPFASLRNDLFIGNFASAAPIPEPATTALCALGITGLAWLRRKAASGR